MAEDSEMIPFFSIEYDVAVAIIVKKHIQETMPCHKCNYPFFRKEQQR